VRLEPNINDYYYQARAIQDEADASAYIEKYRLWAIYYRLENYSFDTYGEINPFLRRHCASLVRSLPEAKTFHLVRDAKDVLALAGGQQIHAPDRWAHDSVRTHSVRLRLLSHRARRVHWALDQARRLVDPHGARQK
jgi:hypothetical protein